jgi:colicin import membrane protein
MWDSIRENPRPVVYAALMHLMLLALLVFSLDWTPKISHPPGIKVPIDAQLVDQSQLDAIAERKAEEQRKIEEAKREAALAEQRRIEEKRKAEQEAKQKAEEAAKQKAEAERKRKADLEAKKKAELEAKRKAEVEAKQKAEQEAKKKAEAEAKKKAEAEAKKKAAAEAKRKAAEAARQREAEQALQQQLAAEQAGMEEARVKGVVAEYIGYIQQRIQRSWLRPPDSPDGLSCIVQVSLIPGGDVARVQIVRSSGNPVFDRSVETAVYKASPLPLPPDAALFKHFRELRLIFKPT